MNREASISSRIRVTKNAYQVLRHAFPSNQHNPAETAELAYVKRGKEKTSRASWYNLRFCSKVLMVCAVAIAFIYVVLSLEATAAIWRASSSKNLMLTPYIYKGNTSEARVLSRVALFPGITSYSGFLTVDETCQSHLFFWFFPAASGDHTAPLILWHGGGPGTSAMFGFHGTGPITLDPDGINWGENKFAWTNHRHMLYLDSPVGTGFSYTEVDEARCYASTSDDVADAVINALRQFYELFPEYQQNDLFISTTSYGGKFAPAIAWRMQNDNQLDIQNGLPRSSSLNLKGVISMSGFSDPIHQVDYGEFYYGLGIIDDYQLKYFLSQESLGKSYMRTKQFYDAYEVIDPLVIGGPGGPSYLKNVTGINYPYNFQEDLLEPQAEKLLHRYEVFLNQKSVQEALHVDISAIGHRFKSGSDVVYLNLLRDLYRSVNPLIESVLDSGTCRFLFTSGQLDLIVPHTTVSKFLHELKWGSEHTFRSMVTSPFSLEPSFQWIHNNKVAGYQKVVGNLTYLLMRDAGHHPFIDQPERTLDFILQFTKRDYNYF